MTQTLDNSSLSVRVLHSRALVFDFDGTLVDSNEIKWAGFEHVFGAYAGSLPAISAYCRGSNHTIRGEKFRRVCEDILGIEYTDDLERKFHEDYAAFTTEAVIRAPEIRGAGLFLSKLDPSRNALLSSTPHTILLGILSSRNWSKYFQHVQGAPIDKYRWLIRFQAELRCSPADVLFFGDTDEDKAAAEAAGCTFVRVGRQPEGDLSIMDFERLTRDCSL